MKDDRIVYRRADGVWVNKKVDADKVRNPLNSSGDSDFKSSTQSDSIRQLPTPPKILTL